MWDQIVRPLAWLAAIIAGLMCWWIILRLAFRAYYKSRAEYLEQQRRNGNADTDQS